MGDRLGIHGVVDILILLRGLSSILQKSCQGRSKVLQCFTFGWKGISWDKKSQFRHSSNSVLRLALQAGWWDFYSKHNEFGGRIGGWHQPREAEGLICESGRLGNSLGWVDPRWSWRKAACTGQGYDTHLLQKWIKQIQIGLSLDIKVIVFRGLDCRLADSIFILWTFFLRTK